MTAKLTDTIADVAIPDTPLVREITEFVRDAEDDLLFAGSSSLVRYRAGAADWNPIWSCSTPERCFTTWA